jgi:hypothetical protein
VIDISPAKAHATSSHPGEPTSRADSADVMKMPDPIIEPITIIDASSVPRLRIRPEPTGFGSVIRSSKVAFCGVISKSGPRA